jgi:hypothetical protein
LGLDEAYIAQSEFNKALVKGIFGVFAPRGDGGHEPSSTRGASGGLHVITQTQRVHEQLGRVPTMQGGGRLFLMAALLTGFAIALYATFISSEYSLALATGTLTATLVGIGFLLRTGMKSQLQFDTIHQKSKSRLVWPSRLPSKKRFQIRLLTKWICRCSTQNRRTVSRLLGANVMQL